MFKIIKIKMFLYLKKKVVVFIVWFFKMFVMNVFILICYNNIYVGLFGYKIIYYIINIFKFFLSEIK